MQTTYGEVPHNSRGVIESELYNKIVQKHFVDKVNYRRHISNIPHPEMSRIIEQKELKRRMRAHPDKKHRPTEFNQIIRL